MGFVVTVFVSAFNSSVFKLSIFFFEGSDGFMELSSVQDNSLFSGMDFIIAIVKSNCEVVEFLGGGVELLVVDFNSGFFVSSFVNGSLVEVSEEGIEKTDDSLNDVLVGKSVSSAHNLS